MVSHPGFTPEAFAVQDSALVQEALEDPRALFMNRATVGAYTPGSIMKLITAMAALEHKVVTPQTTVVCKGSMTIGDRVFHCWNRDGHGAVNLARALMHSCNVYFMHVGRKLGAARLREAFREVGFGRTTGWTLEEVAGRLPQRRLTEGEVAMLAIGQGDLLITPLQAALAVASVVNGGKLMRPWCVRSVKGQMGEPEVRHRLGWSSETLALVREGMRLVVESPEGTGHRAATPAVRIAGKTGTAQTHLPQPHGWFVGYCPEEAPRAAVAVIAEYGGSGGDLPTAIARAICEYMALPEV
jgi:penicillin-binding protein 2